MQRGTQSSEGDVQGNAGSLLVSSVLCSHQGAERLPHSNGQDVEEHGGNVS